jgi:hypothetical protein
MINSGKLAPALIRFYEWTTSYAAYLVTAGWIIGLAWCAGQISRGAR